MSNINGQEFDIYEGIIEDNPYLPCDDGLYDKWFKERSRIVKKDTTTEKENCDFNWRYPNKTRATHLSWHFEYRDEEIIKMGNKDFRSWMKNLNPENYFKLWDYFITIHPDMKTLQTYFDANHFYYGVRITIND